MLTEFLRDTLFTAAWFGLMTMVWLGWAQEDPPRSWRPWLGAGSVLGILLTGGTGYLVVRNWGEPSALEGSYAWFGVLTGVELLAAGIGAVVLARRGQGRWMAWWVGLVVALHFVPLGWLLGDWSVAALGVLLSAGVVALVPAIRRSARPSSALVGPLLGGVLLAFGLVCGVVALSRLG